MDPAPWTNCSPGLAMGECVLRPCVGLPSPDFDSRLRQRIARVGVPVVFVNQVGPLLPVGGILGHLMDTKIWRLRGAPPAKKYHSQGPVDVTRRTGRTALHIVFRQRQG